jgi:hypothetical protein
MLDGGDTPVASIRAPWHALTEAAAHVGMYDENGSGTGYGKILFINGL